VNRLGLEWSLVWADSRTKKQRKYKLDIAAVAAAGGAGIFLQSFYNSFTVHDSVSRKPLARKTNGAGGKASAVGRCQMQRSGF